MTDFGGRIASLLTNYDVTFWLLLQSALDSRPPSPFQSAPCTALPWRSISLQPLSPEVGATLASLNLLLVHAKVEDDQADGETWKPRLARALYSQRFEKAENYLRERAINVDILLRLPKAQGEVERAADPTLDRLAEPTEKTLGEVFASIAILQDKPELQAYLREFGENLGGYLYLWDALVDLPDDLRHGAFNALSACGISQPRDPRITLALNQRLSTLEGLLQEVALGPEGDLCRRLLASLRSELAGKVGCTARQAIPRPTSRLARAGFLKAQSDEGCEGDCCNCGCCDCNMCDCNPCGDGNKDQCCEVSCCDCQNGCCCCPCDGGGGGSGGSNSCCGSSGGSNSSCCGGSNHNNTSCCGSSSTSDAVCCLTDCCFCYSNEPIHTHQDHVPRSRRTGLLQRWQDTWSAKTRGILSTPGGLTCPACAERTLSLKIGEIDISECRNCGGMWVQEKDLEALSKMANLPHNLLTRYPMESRSIEHLAGHRDCPTCDVKLSAIPYLEVPVEMCKKCRGFWVEHGRLGKLLKAKRSPEQQLKAARVEWRCPYCDKVAGGGDTCQSCGAPRPSSGFTGKLA